MTMSQCKSHLPSLMRWPGRFGQRRGIILLRVKFVGDLLVLNETWHPCCQEIMILVRLTKNFWTVTHQREDDTGGKEEEERLWRSDFPRVDYFVFYWCFVQFKPSESTSIVIDCRNVSNVDMFSLLETHHVSLTFFLKSLRSSLSRLFIRKAPTCPFIK